MVDGFESGTVTFAKTGTSSFWRISMVVYSGSADTGAITSQAASGAGDS
jgi:hypothetical protein